MSSSAQSGSWVPRWLPWILVAAVAACITLLAVFPAVWLAPRLAGLTEGRLFLRAVEGSVWNGSAEVVFGSVDEPTAARALPGRFAWQVRMVPLLTGSLEARVMNPHVLSTPVGFIARHDSLRLERGQLVLPLKVLSGLGAPFNTLNLDGHADCSWGAWDVQSGQLSGTAEIHFLDLSSPLSTVRPLGSYLVTLHGIGTSTALSVSTEKGPLMLDASGSFSALGLSISGHASAQPADQDRLADLLGILGRKEEGRVAFSFGTSN